MPPGVCAWRKQPGFGANPPEVEHGRVLGDAGGHPLPEALDHVGEYALVVRGVLRCVHRGVKDLRATTAEGE